MSSPTRNEANAWMSSASGLVIVVVFRAVVADASGVFVGVFGERIIGRARRRMAVRTPESTFRATACLSVLYNVYLSVRACAACAASTDDATDGARDDGSGVEAVVAGIGALASVA